jgi:putative exosortase-associated protein (TIGR04073 family)
MTIPHRLFVSLLAVGLTTGSIPLAQADTMQSYGSPRQQLQSGRQLPNYTHSTHYDYGNEIGHKALNGFANLTTATLEIPKNIINTSNQSNIFYGIFGGLFKGMVNIGGRMAVGLTDLITFPIPTKPIAYPLYIWDDFDVDTSYGDLFRLQDKGEAVQPVVQAPPPPAPAVAAPKPEPVEYPAQYPQDTNRKLDKIFKKEMMK